LVNRQDGQTVTREAPDHGFVQFNRAVRDRSQPVAQQIADACFRKVWLSRVSHNATFETTQATHRVELARENFQEALALRIVVELGKIMSEAIQQYKHGDRGGPAIPYRRTASLPGLDVRIQAINGSLFDPSRVSPSRKEPLSVVTKPFPCFV